MLRLLLTTLVVCALVGAQVPTCAGGGLLVEGGRFGDPWSVTFNALPFAAALLGADVAPGPFQTPFGNVCLGLTPALVTTPIPLDAAGTYAASGVLPLAPGFAGGSKVWVQGAFAHPALPVGALTNAYEVSFRPPGLAIMSPGAPALALPGNFIALDGINDVVTASLVEPVGNTPAPFRVPRLGWIGWKTNAGPFRFVDDATGALALEVPGVPLTPTYVGSVELTAISSDGSIFFTYALGFPYIVRSYSLPSGALLAQASLTGSPATMDAIPGTSLVYLRQWNRFDVIDGLNGALVATVPLPLGSQFPDSVVHGQTVYSYTSAGLVAIDANVHAVVAGPVQSSLAFGGLLGVGPGFAGPLLWAKGYYPQVGPALFPISLTTLSDFGSILVPAPPTAAKPSAGGTEWLLEITPPGQSLTLYAFRVSTWTLTPIIPSVTPNSLAVLRSGALSKAYARDSSGGLVSFPTDPVGPVGAVIPLPPTASQSLDLISN